jgi:PadR family transcriptional regulator PadR
MKTEKSQTNCVNLEENLKKALTELLILHLLNIREYFIGELSEALKEHSCGVLKISFPYSAVYRLQQDGYILDTAKRVASDGRRRQFYCITQQGREYYERLLASYRYFISGVNTVLNIAL